jgi:6-phosphogluconolactonase (cycloisomerase 2 family)
MLLQTLTTATLAVATSATKLYVSSYTGNITTLDLKHSNDKYSLDHVDTVGGCGANASWLQFDPKRENLYCLDEGIVAANGSLNSYKVDASGALKPNNHLLTPLAPVNSVIYTSPNGTQLMVVAHYAWAVTTYILHPATGEFFPLQHFNFTGAPGPKPQQAAPHPHQIRLDPTGKYFLVPDLGADIVRVFYIDPATLALSERPSIPTPPGSGPRHGVFHASKTGNTTHYYLVAEIANTLTGYKVAYLPSNGGVTLTQITNSSTYGPAPNATFAFNAAAEIAVFGNTLTVSNRNATAFTIKNPDPKNATMVPSDAMATFKIKPDDGTVMFESVSPAGGSFPRMFALSKDGGLAAVGLQNSGRVVIYHRCAVTGMLGADVLADYEGLGGVSSVVWGDK